MKALRALLAVTKDTELKKQIQERLEYDQLCMDVFYQKDRKYIYALEVLSREDAEWSAQGFFEYGEIAVACGKKFGEHFAVAKVELILEEKNADDCDVNCIATRHYGADGNADWYWSDEVAWLGEKGQDSKERFENRYIDIEHPFRNGDFVKLKYNEAFGHDHVRIVDVEYAKLDKTHPKSDLLQNASLLIRGHGGMEEFQDACVEYCGERDGG